MSSNDEKFGKALELLAHAKTLTFRVGDLLLSPNQYNFRVQHVSPDGTATLVKEGSGWARTVKLKCNSSKLEQWMWIEKVPREQQELDAYHQAVCDALGVQERADG